MNRMVSAFRKSLAPKVIISTLVLCLGVIYVAGSALNSQLSAGIKKVNLQSSIVEANSTIFSAQYRLILARGEKNLAVRKVINDVIASATSLTTNESAREVVFLKSPENSRDFNYEITSNLVDPKSIPESLSKKTRKSDDYAFSYISIHYVNGARIAGLAVGQKVTIPNAGQYEMYILYSLVNQNTTLKLIANYLLLTGFFLIILIGLITWLVIRQVVRPVRQAALIATQFTAGNFSERMKVRSEDEISTLGNAFNEMAESLEKQIARLENLSRVQQRFVSDVSHELRTPLTTLRMASEIINSAREGFDPILARSSELMVAQLDRFERLLEDLLEISRFDAEVAVLEAVDFDLVGLANRCADDLALVAKERSTELRIYAREESVIIRADIRRVERILRNLFSNAIDHAEEKPIAVSIVASEHDVAIGVRDFGIGLDESTLIRVFDRFWRADPSRARTRGGTGLGLSIALEDARLHNGELEAWGRPGKGAHFVLTLPRQARAQGTTRLIKLQPDDFYE
ncbi:MAG: HAMP domain-containing protein [Actinobacteria bacterium]|uniref:Sensor histidine kinase MtrB n=1 Tax=freshwater metagenome TaxID=449393 RepID=A0A6J7B216_9ZZZZ|nr:HAMP domain-containing protein [Actinomycetota bacterium]MTB08223.1 HAMP domain-containing protein [Actinomycetota bacterium]